MIRPLACLESVAHDASLALRSLRKSPGFVAVVVLSLALGIGANSTIFSVVDTLLYRPLPYPQPEQLVTIWETQLSRPDHGQPPPIAESVDWKKQNHVFQEIALTSENESAILAGTGRPEAIQVQDVTPSFFSMLGAAPELGRIFLASEMQDASQSVVISTSFWKTRMSGDPNVLGKTLRVNGLLSTVV